MEVGLQPSLASLLKASVKCRNMRRFTGRERKLLHMSVPKHMIYKLEFYV